MICSKNIFLPVSLLWSLHQIISHKKDSWPSYAQFLHFRPGIAMLTQQLASLNAPVYRPSYAIFGGQFMQ